MDARDFFAFFAFFVERMFCLMRYTHIFIDMDGTVLNSAPGVTSSVAYALQKAALHRRLSKS